METKATDVGADKAPEKGWSWTVGPERGYAVEERVWRVVWTFMGGVALWGLWQAVAYLRDAVHLLEGL
jgi:hypothetical protein